MAVRKRLHSIMAISKTGKATDAVYLSLWPSENVSYGSMVSCYPQLVNWVYQAKGNLIKDYRARDMQPSECCNSLL